MRKILDYDGLSYFYKKLKELFVSIADFLDYKVEVDGQFTEVKNSIAEKQSKCFFTEKREVAASEGVALTNNGLNSETTYLIKNTSDTEVIITLAKPSGIDALINLSGLETINIPAGKYCEIVVTQWEGNIMTYNLGIQE